MTDFIIVIDADNKRALAAYQKGLADIERIWPQIEPYASKKDEESSREYKVKTDAYEECSRRNMEVDRKYYEALESWEKTSSWCRGSPPSRPYTEINLPPYRPASILAYYSSIRAELKHMADVAGAALGPFRMTERQVKAMVGWEDGSTIESIKARVVVGDEK
jgi:hypothetical protein